MKIRRNDTVLVITGKDRGKRGTVVRVLPKLNRVVIEGVNIAKRHAKPKAKVPQGGIIEFAAPLAVSNVMLVCGSCNKPTRSKSKITDEGKVRICTHCQAALANEVKKATK